MAPAHAGAGRVAGSPRRPARAQRRGGADARSAPACSPSRPVPVARPTRSRRTLGRGCMPGAPLPLTVAPAVPAGGPRRPVSGARDALSRCAEGAREHIVRMTTGGNAVTTVDHILEALRQGVDAHTW